MKKIMILLFLGLSFTVNSQIIIGENINNGSIHDGGIEICTTNSVRIEIDVKKANVRIIHGKEIIDYTIGKIEYNDYGNISFITCYYENEKFIEVILGGGYFIGISYSHNDILESAEII